MKTNDFVCLSLSPINLAHPGIALAASRGGGIGLLDLEFCKDLDQAKEKLTDLLETAGEDNYNLGLRLHIDQIEMYSELLQSFSTRPHYLLLCGLTGETLVSTTEKLPQGDNHKLLVEVTSLAQAQDIQEKDSGKMIHALVGKGNEAGGWVDEDTSFILTQKLVSLDYPVYVQGGIGIHSAAACRAAGAAGVVLDDQLLLMPESPFPAEWRPHIETLNGKETVVFGERLDNCCRVLARPGFKVIDTLEKLNDEKEIEYGNLPEAVNSWHDQANGLIGWGEPGKMAWPVGQAIGLAARYRDNYKTVGRFIQALTKASKDHILSAKKRKPLAPNNPLAESHGTIHPVVQGPMSRVSDNAEYAKAIAEAGGMPIHAIGTMPPNIVEDLLLKTREIMGELPWGIGLIGFVPPDLYSEQLKEVLKVKPPLALIAGGRPDQAKELEANDIPTYIHVPTPELLELYYNNGVRRFVFEGRECGGHIGPLCSFSLWESAVNTLLDIVPLHEEASVHVLFAGGIHDSRSAAMVSTLCVPLVERGMKVGVIMGTAYLYTKEIVETGALKQQFQDQAIACNKTVNLEVGPGHANRCADSSFANEFYQLRRNLLQDNIPIDELRTRLDDLGLGRLAIATKGIKFDENGNLVDVDDKEQIDKGFYMIGQLSTLREEAITMDELHDQVSRGSLTWLENLPIEDKKTSMFSLPTKPSEIAIIGMGSLFPEAHNSEQYWDNIIKKRESIIEIPKERWDYRIYFDEDKRARDKVYSKWGGFIGDIPFDPIPYGIVPDSLKATEPTQLMALEVVRLALSDAGYADGDFDKENTSIILGSGGGSGELGMAYVVRSGIPQYIEAPSDDIWDRLPEWSGASFAGILVNVLSGRVANRFDLGGLNHTVDAACAASLAAINLGVHELESGHSNMVIAGGGDTLQSPFTFLCFCKTGALSPTGKVRAFDKSADGIVISEGMGAVIMKRLEDAKRDGDRIYAVIRGVGMSADGRGRGLYAPRPKGQMRALRRAYEKAGVPANSIGLYEAHGTGTGAGDIAEVETIITIFNESNTKEKSIALGSVKSQIGHSKTAAGIASLIKAAMAIHHKAIPAHINVDNPQDSIADEESPVYLPKETRPWFKHPHHSRLAGISSFGFGGTNSHVVIEEYAGNPFPGPTGALNWPCELYVIRSQDKDSLSREINLLLKALEDGAEPRLRDLSFTYALQSYSRRNDPVCLSFVAENKEELVDTLRSVLEHLNTNGEKQLNTHVKLELQRPATEEKVAFLFPGQGSQYPDMAREAALYLDEVREAVEKADAELEEFFPKLLSQYMYPPSPYSKEDEERNEKQLLDTHVVQPSLAAIESGFLDFTRRLQIKPDMACGHSFGESAALHTAGVITRDEFLRLSETRGKLMATSASARPGIMAAVNTTRDVLENYLKEVDEVVIANHNSPKQSVVSGPTEKVEELIELLKKDKIVALKIPVAGAFHSELFKDSLGPLTELISMLDLQIPKIPVYANESGKPYPETSDGVRELLSRHLLEPVEFVSQVNSMYEDGARVFVEIGSKNVLTLLLQKILKGRDCVSVSLDGQGGGLRGTLRALASLAARGIQFNFPALYDGRDVKALNLNRLVESTKPKPLAPTTWIINGASARRQNEKVGLMGKIAPINYENSEEEKRKYIAKIIAQHAPRTRKTDLAPQSTPAMRATDRDVYIQYEEPAGSGRRASDQETVNQQAYTQQTLVAYQETMRQFLSLQERVVNQFLGETPLEMPKMSDIPVPPPQAFTPQVQPDIPAPPQPVPEVPVAAEPAPQPVQPQVAPQAPVQAATPAMDREAITEKLLALVSEKTGYPPEMLGLGQDMEADLGIDSIKKVEILGSLQNTLADGNGADIQDKMESFTSSRTLNEIIDLLVELVPEQPAAPPAQPVQPQVQATAAPVPQATEAITRDEVVKKLLGLVGEKTGYPPEMLGLDQDMEADLGIDSIKKVEILGSLQSSVPGADGSQVQDKMEDFTKSRTLNEIVGLLMELAPASAPASPQPAAVAQEPAAPVSAAPVEGISRESVTKSLLGLVSEKTGYPPEMLGLDQDMEADLGIDSIKKVEILGSLQASVPSADGSLVQDKMEEFTRSRSLNDIINLLMELVPAGQVQSVPAPQATKPVAVPASPAPVAEVMDRQTVTTRLLALVSEKTGYPTEMLGLDQDLEADLGIDSIKKVEILGSLQTAIPGSEGPQVQERMEDFTKSRSLNDIINLLLELAPAQPAPAPEAVNVQTEPAAQAQIVQTAVADEKTITDGLLSLVSEKTGYPTEMLGLDQDMEADLGIDSIKKVEILGSLQTAIGSMPGEQVQERMEEFTRSKTIREIINLLVELSGSPSGTPVTTDVQQETTIAAPVQEQVLTETPRFVVVPEKQPIPDGFEQTDLPGGLYLITPDAMSVAPVVAELLKEKGATVEFIEPDVLFDYNLLSSRIEALRDKHGSVKGVIHLSTLGISRTPTTLEEWQRHSGLHAKGLFRILQICADDLKSAGESKEGRVLSATMFGGYLKPNGHSGELAPIPTAGGISGLLKTMTMEWDGVYAKAIDFDTSLSAADIAKNIINEVQWAGGRVEVGYPKGHRTIFQTVPAMLDSNGMDGTLVPSSDWVVLVTGGASGITSETAQVFANSGATLILVGRSAEPGEEDAETAAVNDPGQLRTLLLSRAKSKGNVPKPTELEHEIRTILHNREIRNNINRLRDAGARVEYYSTDVRSESKFGQLIDDIYDRHGKIDAVLHGAGVIEDKLIINKTVDSFDRVYDTKVDSSFILSRNLRPESLKLLIFFSSVAGRYGSRGQADYAAANEVLNRMAWQLDHRWDNTRVVAISWGPWDNTASGMVTEEMKQHFLNEGIIPIPPSSGREFLKQEFEFGSKGEAETIAGQGPWGTSSEKDQ